MTDQSSITQDTNTSLFPHRLYEMLVGCENQAKCHIVSWLPDGKAFKVHQVPEFVATILPRHFRQSKYKSFQRQLNLWGFERVTSNGPEKGAYYHKHFLKGKHSLVKLLTRQRGNKSADSSVHSSPKPTKQKNPKIKRTTAAKHLEHPTFSTKVECLKGKNLKTDSEVIKIETGTTQYEERLSVSSPRSIDKAFTQQETSIIPDRKLFFEGCEFFPLEEERYDELEEVILEASADLLNWPRLQNDPEPSISASRPPTFGLPPPPSQLCRV